MSGEPGWGRELGVWGYRRKQASSSQAMNTMAAGSQPWEESQPKTDYGLGNSGLRMEFWGLRVGIGSQSEGPI